MIENELPRVTDEEARQNLSDLIGHSGDPFRVIQHLKSKVAKGGIHGRLHNQCIIAVLAECYGLSFGLLSRESDRLSLRAFRRLFLKANPDPHSLLPIEIYLLDIRPEDTSETSRELKIIAEYCDNAYNEFVYERSGMMVVS